METYVFDDVHMDPDIYPDPLIYDPGRYLTGLEEDKKVQHGYLGWGVGLHPCREYLNRAISMNH
jgi:cytochrome P450